MDYCHQVGLRFDWLVAPNLVTEQCFWDNPDKRAAQEAGGYYGDGLSWSKGKDLILKNHRYAFEFFRGMDDLHMIFSEVALTFEGETGTDPTAYIRDVAESYLQLLRETGNDAGFVYRNWNWELWTKILMSEALLQKYPKYRTIQDDIIPLLPKNSAWVDRSLLTTAQVHYDRIQARGNPRRNPEYSGACSRPGRALLWQGSLVDAILAGRRRATSCVPAKRPHSSDKMSSSGVSHMSSWTDCCTELRNIKGDMVFGNDLDSILLTIHR
jgi:hypothetical protein